MYLIIGLGNMGKQYQGTRHNIGFEVIDYLAEKKGVAVKKKQHHGVSAVYREFGKKIMLAKPSTYMNNSGLCVFGLLNFYEVPLENLLIIYDDIDLSVGDVRMRQKGSGGTHNGMRSIVSHIKTQDFSRIRIGIGKQPSGFDLANYVLNAFPKSDFPLMEEAVITSTKGIDYFVKDGIDLAMNRINSRKKTEKEV